MSVHLDPETLGAGVLQAMPSTSPGAPLGTSPHQVVPHHPSGGHPPGAIRKVASGVGTFFRTSFVVGVSFIVGVVVLERFGPIEWRPSTWLGAFAGRQDAAQILTAIEARRAEFAMQKEEEARAQQEVAALQADNQRVTDAYKAQFDRGTAMAQTWAAGAKEALVLETQSRIAALKGMSGVSSTKDSVAMFCDLGKLLSPDIDCGDQLRASARHDRDAMTAEIVGNFRAQSVVIAQSLRDWSLGLPDPAELVAMKAKLDRLHPLPRAAVPPPPIPEQRTPPGGPVGSPPGTPPNGRT